jgi:sulfur relay (sulfurtransferase) complex TusBCD TusD component (DsrE family)
VLQSNPLGPSQQKICYLKVTLSQMWQLVPVILATWEVESKRIEVQSQPWQKAGSHLNQQQGVVVHICHPCYMGSINRGIKVLAKTYQPQN